MTTFTQLLLANGYAIDGAGNITNGSGTPITQSQFSTLFTSWLKSDSVFGSSDFYNYVDSQNLANEAAILQVLQNGTYTVALNQNSNGAPYIVELQGLIDFNALFLGAEDTIVKTGNTTQVRWYTDALNLPVAANQAPTADPIVLELTEFDEHATANSNPVLQNVNLLTDANANDPDGDPLSIVNGSVQLSGGGALPDYITYLDGVLTIDKNHPALDDLYLNATWNVMIEYQITDGTNTITNTVDLTITGTADQFSGSNGGETSASWTNASGGGASGAMSITLLAPDGAFDFSGNATATVTGDIDAANETVAVTLELNNIGIVGDNPVLVGGIYQDQEVIPFGSTDNQVSVSYQATPQVNPGNLTVSIDEYYYWQ